jgi:dTDP-4-amino-4,6-dideoxygalactose transaminase
MIPLVDLAAQYETIRPDIASAIARVLDRTQFILGPEVEEFERAFAAYCEARHAVGVGSGTAALHLALLACGIGPGDEVITTPHTFIATAEAISYTGGRPVFVDVEPDTMNLDPALVEAAIGPRTRAIIAVHLYGRPCDMARLGEIARRRGLVLVEDAAQAHGARLGGRRVGTFADAACFSFYPGKNLGAYGDAGAVVTGRDDIAARVRMLRDHGRCDKYTHETVGFGERLDALQAAILGVKLRHLEGWNARRRAAAARYRELLAGAPLALPVETDGVESVYHLFVVRLPDRDRVLARLKQAGIGAGVHYPIPLHRQPAYADLGYAEGRLPHAERAAREVLSLPIYPEITDAQLVTVATALRSSLS